MGRKEYLIISIRLERNIHGGMSVSEAKASTRGYLRKTVAELQEIYRNEKRECPKCAYVASVRPCRKREKLV